MTFVSPIFLIFLVCVYTIYWLADRRTQNLVILLASLLFYGWWDWHFLLLLLAIASIDYFVALALTPNLPVRRRKLLLTVSLVTNLGTLVYFKYLNFFSLSLQKLLGHLGFQADAITLSVILPLGVSFYTFQALSYTIDVYRGRLPPVRSYVEYLGFITFFPHMIAGPIQQATHLLVQFGKERHFSRVDAVDGLRQMLWGYFKKMVLADTLAGYVNPIYATPGTASGWQLLWATYFFAMQIYGDFSGYTDIAIGSARLFGFHMTRNFAYPYFAANIHEFWRRWHISLSTWFREYLYIPLGGNRCGRFRTALNVLIVFVVSGLWHGANWTFLCWGALHGLYSVVYQLVGHWLGKMRISRTLAFHLFSVVVLFQLVCIGWVFFRAADLSSAVLVLNRIGSACTNGKFSWPPTTYVGLCGLVLGLEWIHRHKKHGLDLAWPRPFRFAIYYGLLVMILALSPLGYVPFIYFQF